MIYSVLSRSALALFLVVPVTAAHPTETQPAASGSFETSFEAFASIPSPQPLEKDVVDLAQIAHSHAPASASGSGRALDGGLASYYGRQFDGRRTASGERFDMAALTAAHRTLPFGSKVRVTNPSNGRSVIVRINDRGPFHGKRVIDVSQAAAHRLGLIAAGSARVSLTLLD